MRSAPFSQASISGAGIAWASLCKNIENQTYVATKQLSLLQEGGNAFRLMVQQTANSTRDALIDEANATFNQGLCGCIGSGAQLAATGISTWNYTKEEVAIQKFEKGVPERTELSFKQKNEPIEMEELSEKRRPAIDSSEEVSITASRKDDNIDQTKSELKKEERRTSKTAAERRRENDVKLQSLNAVGQSLNGLLTGAGGLAASQNKKEQAENQKKVTEYTGAQNILTNAMDINKSALNGSESSMQGTIQVMSAITQACSAGYRG